MSDIPKTVQIQVLPESDHFVIRRVDMEGTETRLSVTAEDVMDLARSLPQFAGHILGPPASDEAKAAGFQSSAMAELRKARVNVDALAVRVLLFLEDEFDLTSGYALDATLARGVGESLIKQADFLESAERDQKKQ